jgi:hypothetical protein
MRKCAQSIWRTYSAKLLVGGTFDLALVEDVQADGIVGTLEPQLMSFGHGVKHISAPRFHNNTFLQGTVID